MFIRAAANWDFPVIETLLMDAFGGPAEARLVDALRRDGDKVIELVAEEDGALYGTVMLSRLHAPDRWLALAPVAVAAERRGQGIGVALIREAIAASRTWEAAVVVGEPAYYARFGFSVALAGALRTPYPKDKTGVLQLGITRPEAQVELRYPPAFKDV